MRVRRSARTLLPWVILSLAGVLFSLMFVRIDRRLVANTQRYEELASVLTMAVEFRRAETASLPSENSPWFGAESALVDVVEFTDLECSSCRSLVAIRDSVMRDSVPGVRWVYKYLRSGLTARSDTTAWLAMCAAEGGVYWEFVRRMTELYNVGLASETWKGSVDSLLRAVSGGGLNWKQCLSDGRYRIQPRIDQAQSQALGLRRPPVVFVNGRRWDGPITYSALRALLVGAVAEAQLQRGAGLGSR